MKVKSNLKKKNHAMGLDHQKNWQISDSVINIAVVTRWPNTRGNYGEEARLFQRVGAATERAVAAIGILPKLALNNSVIQ